MTILHKARPFPTPGKPPGRMPSRRSCAEFAYRQGEPAGRVHALLKWALEDESVAIGPPVRLRGPGSSRSNRARSGWPSDADRAIAACPAAGRAYSVRGRVRLERGQSAAALADLTEANRLSEGKDGRDPALARDGPVPEGPAGKGPGNAARAVQLRPGDQGTAGPAARIRTGEEVKRPPVLCMTSLSRVSGEPTMISPGVSTPGCQPVSVLATLASEA